MHERIEKMQPINLEDIPVESDDIVNDTWKAIGKTLRATGEQLFIRTHKPRTQTAGGIHLPAKTSDFYQGLPNYGVEGRATAYRRGTVVSVGPDVHLVKVGDSIIFPRAVFIGYKELDDSSRTGWIKESEVWAIDDGDNA